MFKIEHLTQKITNIRKRAHFNGKGSPGKHFKIMIYEIYVLTGFIAESNYCTFCDILYFYNVSSGFLLCFFNDIK